MFVMEDVCVKKDGFITRLFHHLDLGQYIRQTAEYQALLEKKFNITYNFDIKSGVFPYQIFILKCRN